MSETPPDDRPASVDEQTATAYRLTDYYVNEFRLRIGQPQPDFDRYLAEHSYRSYTLLTAHNPYSVALPAPVNAARHRTLLTLVRQLGLTYLPARGEAPGGDWPTEVGVCLLDVPLTQVVQLGRVYEQNALVRGRRWEPPRLIWL